MTQSNSAQSSTSWPHAIKHVEPNLVQSHQTQARNNPLQTKSAQSILHPIQSNPIQPNSIQLCPTKQLNLIQSNSYNEARCDQVNQASTHAVRFNPTWSNPIKLNQLLPMSNQISPTDAPNEPNSAQVNPIQSNPTKARPNTIQSNSIPCKPYQRRYLPRAGV